MSVSHSKKRKATEQFQGHSSDEATVEQLPTISEDDRRELRQELYDYVKDTLGESEGRASYLADTYSLVSRSD